MVDQHIRQYMPPWLDDYVRQMTFSLSFADNSFPDLATWKAAARAKAFELIGYDPPAVPFAPETLATEDKGKYLQHRLTFAATPWYRVPAYLLVPKGSGPFPAVVNCHDHGAFFLYGKEKLVETEADQNAGLKEFKRVCYGGRSTANVLAERGYVVLVTDALFWGERASRDFGEAGIDTSTVEGVQQWNAACYRTAAAFSTNLLNAGISWCAVLLRDDLRAAEFLASLPMVDAGRIASCGLSVGCFRSWSLAALSDLIAASVNIGWMTDLKSQMLARCNMTTSEGAMSFTIPQLKKHLDFSDFASMAAPRPALFFNGLRDGLFPVPSVEHAYAQMQQVWDSQGLGDRLCCRLWDVPHEFNREMQEEAFDWLDRWLK
ncbi:MAG: alpha/beta hydrolase family protein [Candidatus Latescibacterota bacterium]